MPVRLDLHPELASRPAPVRIWFWLGLLLAFLIVGAGSTLLFATPSLGQHSLGFWELSLGLPVLVWGALGFVRWLIYLGQQSAAHGWNEAREESLSRKIRRGRRSLQVLSADFYSALWVPGQDKVAQLDALLSGVKALKAQPSGLDAAVRHSRLACSVHDAHEDVLLRALQHVLAELGKTLENVPDDTPLALLLEVDSNLPDGLLNRVWREAWRTSGIRQSTAAVEGRGLDAVDLWLDRHIDDQALLMLIALQFAPQPAEATAEVAVGLLLGNRLTQTTLPPIAYLHRPEQARGRTDEHLLYAARQALDWVPQPAHGIEQAWLSGIGPDRRAAMTTVLTHLSMPVKQGQRLVDLDACLGHAGSASPGLAIAAAAQTIERGGGPQFIFSGGNSAAECLWGMVLMPASALSR